jgi:hypothetical protein
LYARAVPRPLPAEVFLDAVAQVTGVDERFSGVPEGTRAVQLAGPVVGSMALDVLGRCSRERACDAGDGGVGGGLAQALHLIQGGTIQGRLGAGTVAAWLERPASDAGIVEDLWLRAFGRWPRPEEREHWEGMLKAAANRREAVEDLMWTVLNSGEFAFNH